MNSFFSLFKTKEHDGAFIFGSARSGTSWLSETLSKRRGYRLLFEPDQSSHISRAETLMDRLLLSYDNDPVLDSYISDLRKNRVDNNWIAQNSYRKFKAHLWPFMVEKVIIKFVRSNLAISYFLSHFDVPLVYIVRDPYSCLFSQKRVSFPWLYELDLFREDPIVHSKLVNQGIDLDHHDYSNLEKLAIRWGIENLLFREKWLSHPSFNLLRYEDVAGNPDRIRKLIDRIGLKAPENLEKIVGIPSSKTHPKSELRRAKTIPSANQFTQKEIAQIEQILSIFGYNKSKESMDRINDL